MRRVFKRFSITLAAGIVAMGMCAPTYAYNSVPAGSAAQRQPILNGSNVSLNGATWTPFGSYDAEIFQLHPNQKKTPNMRLYPKPDGATLPPMGWNSWNAFFSNISADTIAGIADQMADKDPVTGEPLNGLGLRKAGYRYVIVDDGCYASRDSFTPNSRFSGFSFNGRTGFGALGDYVHSLGLKYGMYNDAGPATCAGSGPGAYPAAGGREDAMAASLIDWGIDVLKYDWCGNPWGIQSSNWTGGGPDVQRMVVSGHGYSSTTDWASAAPTNVIYGGAANRNSGGYLAGLGIATGGTSLRDPTYIQGFAHVTIADVPEYGDYTLSLTRRNGGGSTSATGGGRYIMVDVNGDRQYEGMVSSSGTFTTAGTNEIPLTLKAGTNVVTLYNTKNQEIGLYNYAAMRDALNKSGGQNVSLKQCDWGNTGAWSYGQMIGETHRQYSDIFGEWTTMGSWGWVRDEYSRAVYANDAYDLRLGGTWSDPDMLVVALGTSRQPANAWTREQNKQHFDGWAITNSPLVLGFDLRDESLRARVEGIIDNRSIIALNQDPLGVAGRRIKVSTTANPRSFITGNRVEAVMKPLANGNVAVYFGNWSGGAAATMTLSVDEIVNSYVSDYMTNKDTFAEGPTYVKNLNTGALVATLTSPSDTVTARFAATNDSVTYLFSKTPLAEGLNTDSTFGVGLAFDQIDFVGGKIQVGPNEYFQNRANGIGMINNNTEKTIHAAVKLDLYNAKGNLVWSKTGPTQTVEPGCLVPWEYKEALPDIVVGYSMTATLLDAQTGQALAPSYTRYAAPPEPNSLSLALAGGVFTNPNGTQSVSSLDAGLVASNPVNATATVYNDADDDIETVVVFALYNEDGSLSDAKLSQRTTIRAEDLVTLSAEYFLPSDVAGKTVRAFLLDAKTYLPLADLSSL